MEVKKNLIDKNKVKTEVKTEYDGSKSAIKTWEKAIESVRYNTEILIDDKKKKAQEIEVALKQKDKTPALEPMKDMLDLIDSLQDSIPGYVLPFLLLRVKYKQQIDSLIFNTIYPLFATNGHKNNHSKKLIRHKFLI